MDQRLTRKEIAREVNLSVDVIRKNEVRLGLLASKVSFNQRVLYIKGPALQALKARKLL